MRTFDYTKLYSRTWSMTTVNLLTQIHEYRGKQELYVRQKPVELEHLIEVAKIQSIEASNRIEGIVTTSTRIGKLMQEKTAPKNRDEKEIAGYRDVLNTIHEHYQYIPISSNVILQLHRDLMQYADTGMGGRFKNTQNYIRETRENGEEYIRFTPVAPYETERCIEEICASYERISDEQKLDSLIGIPVFINDFLCIHPFNDGNGRLSRLLTLLLLYQAGYQIGKYISIEKHIEKTKEAYYDSLEEAGIGWHEGENDPSSFVDYFLSVLLGCYRELDDRINAIEGSVHIVTGADGKEKSVRVKSTAYDIVKAAVESRIGKFTKKEILDICPSIGSSSVEAGLKRLTKEKIIEKHGKGKNTFYAIKQ